MSNVLEFSSNWNNKLNSKYFSTLRMSPKWIEQPILIVKFKDKAKIAKIKDARKIKVSQLNDFICYLDTGYNKEQTIKILEKMYSYDQKVENRTIYLYLIECQTDWLELPINEINLDLY